MRRCKKVYSLKFLSSMEFFDQKDYTGYDIALDLARDSFSDALTFHKVELQPDGDTIVVTLQDEPFPVQKEQE